MTGVTETGVGEGGRPLELQAAVLTAMSKMALGEAQALTAHRGEVRGMAPVTISALHVAAMGALHVSLVSFVNAAVFTVQRFVCQAHPTPTRVSLRTVQFVDQPSSVRIFVRFGTTQKSLHANWHKWNAASVYSTHGQNWRFAFGMNRAASGQNWRVAFGVTRSHPRADLALCS